VLLAGFYGGLRVGQGQPVAAAANQPGPGTGLRGGAGGFQGFSQAACSTAAPSPAASPSFRRQGTLGTITRIDNGTLTIHDPRCGTDTRVTFDQSLIVRKTVAGQASDLQENQMVQIQGQRQADGTIKATSVTVVPAGTQAGQ
jgi:hypothetical protein